MGHFALRIRPEAAVSADSMELCAQEPAGHGAASALDAFQTAHILRCAAIQHQALGEHVAGIRCLHAATTLAPADPAVWLLLGWAIAELAAYPAASEEAFHAVINLLGAL